jgi:hypothetical protein
MTGNTHIHPSSIEHSYDSLNEDEQQLAEENRALRALVAGLLIKNQNLRWALLGQGTPILAYEPRALATSGGTPFRRKPRTAVMP